MAVPKTCWTSKSYLDLHGTIACNVPSPSPTAYLALAKAPCVDSLGFEGKGLKRLRHVKKHVKKCLALYLYLFAVA